MYLKIFSAKFCCSCIVLFSIITSTPSTPSFIISIFRLGCCPFPIQWGWQHQDMPNTASPSISVLWVNLSQATYNDFSLDTFRPCLTRPSFPSEAGKRNVCDRFDTGCGPPNLSLIWSDIVFCHAIFFQLSMASYSCSIKQLPTPNLLSAAICMVESKPLWPNYTIETDQHLFRKWPVVFSVLSCYQNKCWLIVI